MTWCMFVVLVAFNLSGVHKMICFCWCYNKKKDSHSVFFTYFLNAIKKLKWFVDSVRYLFTWHQFKWHNASHRIIENILRGNKSSTKSNYHKLPNHRTWIDFFSQFILKQNKNCTKTRSIYHMPNTEDIMSLFNAY